MSLNQPIFINKHDAKCFSCSQKRSLTCDLLNTHSGELDKVEYLKRNLFLYFGKVMTTGKDIFFVQNKSTGELLKKKEIQIES